MNTINKVKRQMTNRQKTFHHISQRIISLLNIVFLKIEKIKIQHLDRKVNQWYKFSSVAQSCPTLCDPTSCSMPGLPVHHQLPEFTQTHVHRVSDAIQSSHPLSPPSPAAPIPPSIRVFSNESTLHMRWPKYWFQLQHQSFQWTPRTDLL